MTEIQSKYLKNNWSKFINVGTFISVLGFVVFQSKWQQKVDEHIRVFETHKIDKSLHMPFKDKIELFVPRVELEGQMEDMKELLKEIRHDLKTLNSKK